MKVKELIAKYPNHDVIAQGYPNSIPFTQLPSELQGLSGKAYEKAFMELEVKGYKVENKQFTSIDSTHIGCGGKKRPNKTFDGKLFIYLKSDKNWGVR